MTIRSPFPGMDPWLEQHWRDVHQRLIIYASDALQSHLPPGLIARVKERVFVDDPDAPRSIYPDVRVVERGRRVPGVAAAPEAVSTAEPLTIEVGSEPESEGFIEIREVGSGGRVVTVVEVVSQTNKAAGEGRRLYRRKQRELKAGLVSLVEIDLLRGGRWVLSIARGHIPPPHRTEYQVCVRRGWRPTKMEVYPVPLRERLPVIRVPLRKGDADAPLDLQALVDQAYRNGRYDTLDYKADPDPPLRPQDAAWADGLLKSSGHR